MEGGGPRGLWAWGVVAKPVVFGLGISHVPSPPPPPSRIADFQDVLKEPTIALEKLRELSFSGERQRPNFRVSLEQHCGRDGGGGAQG